MLKILFCAFQPISESILELEKEGALMRALTEKEGARTEEIKEKQAELFTFPENQ